MSVLECARLDCDNIMCERYSPEYGYICSSCFSELASLGIQQDIDEFLRGDSATDANAWEHFDGIFRRQGDNYEEI